MNKDKYSEGNILHQDKVRIIHQDSSEVAECTVATDGIAIKAAEPVTIPWLDFADYEEETLINVDGFDERLSFFSDTDQQSGPVSKRITLRYFDSSETIRELTLEIKAFQALRQLKWAINRQLLVRFLDEAQERKPVAIRDGKIIGGRQSYRNETVSHICTTLQKFGLDAMVTTRGRIVEGIKGQGCDGIIHVPEGLIVWVKVYEAIHTDESRGYTYTDYCIDYGIPDFRLGPDFSQINIQSNHVKNIPLVGHVVDLRWKGFDDNRGIIDRLNNDTQLRQAMMGRRDVNIRAFGDSSCWLLWTMSPIFPVLSRELWDCYQSIAQHLLADWMLVG